MLLHTDKESVWGKYNRYGRGTLCNLHNQNQATAYTVKPFDLIKCNKTYQHVNRFLSRTTFEHYS